MTSFLTVLVENGHESRVKTTNLPAPAWMLLGELEVAVSADAEGITSAWLGDVLEPPGIPADLQSRIVNAARETVVPTAAPGATASESAPIHLRIFVTTAHATKRGTWGFFLIEKTDSAADEYRPRDHSIEFYLYVESQ